MYEYCGNGPVGMSDASGMAEGDPTTNTGKGCGIKALLSLIGSSEAFHNGFDWNALFAAICSAVMNCSAGAMCTALGNILNIETPIVGCIAGARCSLTGNVLSDLCTVFSDCPGRENVPKKLCNMLFSAVSGCVSGAIPNVGGIAGRAASGTG